MTIPRKCDGCGCDLADDEDFYCEDCVYDQEENDEFEDEEDEE